MICLLGLKHEELVLVLGVLIATSLDAGLLNHSKTLSSGLYLNRCYRYLQSDFQCASEDRGILFDGHIFSFNYVNAFNYFIVKEGWYENIVSKESFRMSDLLHCASIPYCRAQSEQRKPLPSCITITVEKGEKSTRSPCQMQS